MRVAIPALALRRWPRQLNGHTLTSCAGSLAEDGTRLAVTITRRRHDGQEACRTSAWPPAFRIGRLVQTFLGETSRNERSGCRLGAASPSRALRAGTRLEILGSAPGSTSAPMIPVRSTCRDPPGGRHGSARASRRGPTCSRSNRCRAPLPPRELAGPRHEGGRHGIPELRPAVRGSGVRVGRRTPTLPGSHTPSWSGTGWAPCAAVHQPAWEPLTPAGPSSRCTFR